MRKLSLKFLEIEMILCVAQIKPFMVLSKDPKDKNTRCRMQDISFMKKGGELTALIIDFLKHNS